MAVPVLVVSSNAGFGELICQILDETGGALMFFGGPSSARDSINLPTVVKIDYDNVKYFQEFVSPDFDVEYLVVVAGQFGLNKVVVYGFGSLRE